MSHELGHAMDYLKGNRLFADLVFDGDTRRYNPVTRLKKYYAQSEEIAARLIEQYVEVKKGMTDYYTKDGYWKKEIFDRLAPKVQKIIDEKFSDYKK